MSDKCHSNEDNIQNVIINNATKKIEYTKEYLCNLEEMIPNSFEVDIVNRKIMHIYFVPECETEEEKIVEYISNFINYLFFDMNTFVSSSYSFIETLLKDKISKEYNIKEYEKYCKDKREKGSIDNYIDYILLKSNRTLNEKERFTVDYINKARLIRNGIVHDLQPLYTHDNTLKFIIGNGIDINSKLYCFLDFYIGNINEMLDIFKEFILLYKTL